MEIIRNIKGIKKLEINEREWEQLVNSENIFHGIYGPNGSGKSSFKEALLEKEPTPHWGAKDEIFIDDKIKMSSSKYAIFDERVVDLVRRGIEGRVNIFGEEVNNLYELLTNRKNFLKKHNSREIIEEKILKISKKELEECDLKLSEALEFIGGYEKHLESNETSKKIRLNIYGLAKISLDRFLYLFKGDKSETQWVGGLQKKKFKIGILQLPKTEELFSEMEEGSRDIQDILEGAKIELNDLKDFVGGIFDISHNFGYVAEAGVLQKIYDWTSTLKGGARYVERGIFSNLVNTLEFEENNPGVLRSVWEGINEKVQKVLNISNNFLLSYNLGYSVDLKKTIISNEESNNNFSLLHNSTNKKLSEIEIEKSVSFGELNIISLNIFLASIITRDIEDGSVILFDDPVSSYDLNRVQITIGIIYNLFSRNEKVKNVFFLSHEKYFIKSLTFAFYNKITKWNLSKGEVSELKMIHAMESDYEFYLNIFKTSNNKISQLISERFLTEIEEIKGDITLRTKKEIHNELYKDEGLKNDLNLPKKDEINKEDLISLKSIVKLKHQGFLAWLKTRNFEIVEIISSGGNPTKEQMLIFRIAAQMNILNALNHSDRGEDINLDTSRTAEKVDILFSSKDNLLNDLNDALEIWGNIKEVVE